MKFQNFEVVVVYIHTSILEDKVFYNKINKKILEE